MKTVTLSKELAEKIHQHFANQTFSSGLGELYDGLTKAMTIVEPVQAVMKGKKASVKSSDSGKTVKASQLAREFLSNNPDAKLDDVVDYLVNKHIKPNTAKSTAYNAFKKVKKSED